jgi:hypothetical protein
MKEVSPRLVPSYGPWSPVSELSRAGPSCQPQHTQEHILGCHLLKHGRQKTYKEELPNQTNSVLLVEQLKQLLITVHLAHNERYSEVNYGMPKFLMQSKILAQQSDDNARILVTGVH